MQKIKWLLWAFPLVSLTLHAHTFPEKKLFTAQGEGVVDRPVKEVWAVLHSTAGLKWSEAEVEKGIRRIPSTEYAFVFDENYIAGPAFARQRWRMEWYHELQLGDLDRPQKISITYKKVAGTTHIKQWKGRIELEELTPESTSVTVVNEIEGTQINQASAQGGVEDLYKHLQQLPPNYAFFPE